MTIPRRDNGDTPFSAWIRSQAELDSGLGYDLEDFDHIHSRQFVWHQYLIGALMLIEEKQHNREPTFAQRDTMDVLSQALRHSFGDPSFRLKRINPLRPHKLAFFGYHLIQFENTSPSDGRIRIGGIHVTEQELRRFLQFDKRFMIERFRFNPQIVTLSEIPAYYHLPKPKHRLHNGNLPTLFNPTPEQQQAFEWEASI